MFRFILIILIFIPFTAFSQISLEECYSLAKSNYPQIKQADLIDKMTDYNITNANMGYLPKVLFSARASYQSDVTKIPFDVPYFDIPVLSKDQYKLTVDISQTIWDGGKIEADKAKIKAEQQNNKNNLESQLYNIRYQVAELYFSILLMQEQLIQNDILEKDLARTYEMVKNNVRNGVANNSDLDKVALEQIKTKQNKAQINAGIQIYMTALETLIGQKIENGLLKPSEYDFTDYTIKRPELELFTSRINLLDVNKKMINSSYMPKFDLFFQGGYGRPGLDMLSDEFEPFYIVGVKMDWTIVGFYTGERTKKLIDLNKASVELERQTFLFNTNIDIENQKAKIEKIKETMSYDDEILMLKGNILKSSEIKMKQGTLSVNDYLQDVTALNIAKQGKILHEIELLKATYELKNIINQ